MRFTEKIDRRLAVVEIGGTHPGSRLGGQAMKDADQATDPSIGSRLSLVQPKRY